MDRAGLSRYSQCLSSKTSDTRVSDHIGCSLSILNDKACPRREVPITPGTSAKRSVEIWTGIPPLDCNKEVSIYPSLAVDSGV